VISTFRSGEAEQQHFGATHPAELVSSLECNVHAKANRFRGKCGGFCESSRNEGLDLANRADIVTVSCNSATHCATRALVQRTRTGYGSATSRDVLRINPANRIVRRPVDLPIRL